MIGRYLSAIFPLGLFESLQILDDNGVDLIVSRKMDELEAWAFVPESYKAQSTQLDRPSCIPAAFDLVLVTPFLTWNQADISLRFCPRSTNDQQPVFYIQYCSILSNRTYYLPVLVLGKLALRASLDDLSILSLIKPVSSRRLQHSNNPASTGNHSFEAVSRAYSQLSPWRQPQAPLTLQITPPLPSPLSVRPSTPAVLALARLPALVESVLRHSTIPLAL